MAFEQVSKRFRRRRPDTLAELLPALALDAMRSIARRRVDSTDRGDQFWALKDVSFAVEPGEVLGIIGANGAGKSTVLRLLTGLLRPDRGRVEVHGRIGALIELAAGFHPDLTGRENVFLQGAIMGLSNAEIRRRFDEIIAFAGVDGFVDTQLKRYSSGMHARLGFAVAAHCEPDVLLIDEVLAVGDRAFQERAYARLEHEVARGIPVVVVSHQLDRIARLCRRGLLLSHGAVAFEGSAQECVAAYVDGVQLAENKQLGECPIRLGALTIANQPHGRWRAGDRVELLLDLSIGSPSIEGVSVGVRISSIPDETLIATVHQPQAPIAAAANGCAELRLALTLNLGGGVYRIQGVAWKTAGGVEWARGDSLMLEVEGSVGSVGRVWLDPHFAPMQNM